jgi:cell division protein FtsQ
MTTVSSARGLHVLSRVRMPRLTVRRLIALLVVALILFIGWLWLRSSDLVAVKQVQVTGVSGRRAGQIRSALRDEALTMTTLDVSIAKLEQAVSAFPHIAGLRVSTDFPHGLRIAVDERTPVASVASGGGAVAVDASGLALPHDATAGLPSLSAAPDTGGNRVTNPSTLTILKVLGAAPYQYLSHLSDARTTPRHGIVVGLRNGPDLYFGDGTQLRAKWSAVSAVLANANSVGAAYIDVSAPDQPAAGSTDRASPPA